jgi:hypothetical protein
MKTAYDYEQDFFKHHWRKGWLEVSKWIGYSTLIASPMIIGILIFGTIDIADDDGGSEPINALDFMRTMAALASVLAIAFLVHWRKWKKQMSVERARWWKHLESTQGEQKF